MTIEEHKEHLLDMMDSMPDDACGDWRDSLAYAIETMNKYQQIEQMVKQYKKFGNIDFSMQIICGVVEDGNVD